MIEYIDSIMSYAQQAWPFVVSTAAVIGGTTAGILNFQNVKKTKLEIEKLEKEAEKDDSKTSIIKIPTNEEIAKLGNIRVSPEKGWPRNK